jgi:hypothetical protein
VNSPFVRFAAGSAWIQSLKHAVFGVGDDVDVTRLVDRCLQPPKLGVCGEDLGE